MNILPLEKRQQWRSTILDHIAKNFSSNEIWMIHPKTEQYLVSSLGRVKNYMTGNILTPHPNKNGYLCINIQLSKTKRMSYMVHRLVAETFYPYVLNEELIYEVNHIDGNKTNNNYLNLEWLTRRENLNHSRLKKLSPNVAGENNPRCKISDSEIKDMLELVDLGYQKKQIYKAYGVTKGYLRSPRALKLKEKI